MWWLLAALAVVGCEAGCSDGEPDGDRGAGAAGSGSPASANGQSQAGTRASAAGAGHQSTATGGGGTAGARDAGTAGAGAGSPRDAAAAPADASGPRDAQSAPADAGSSPSCIVARRMDRCCAPYQPVPRSALAADECLYAFPAWPIDREREQRCAAKRGNCAATTCPVDPLPPSRIAAPDDSGACRYVDECQDAADCVLALAEGRCCECPSAVPAALLEVNRCVVREGAAPANCRDCSLPILCEQCLPAEPASCAIGDALNRCQ